MDFGYLIKPGSHMCDKHNTSEISISISTRKRDHFPYFLSLCLFHLCYAYRTGVNQDLRGCLCKIRPLILLRKFDFLHKLEFRSPYLVNH